MFFVINNLYISLIGFLICLGRKLYYLCESKKLFFFFVFIYIIILYEEICFFIGGLIKMNIYDILNNYINFY